MSANVDERIVQMQFDNQQFEAKAQNTITTLNSLSQALQLPTATTKGFDQVQESANKLNFDKINQAIETVNYRFSTFGIFATNVLNRISNAAIDMGKRLIESVTTQPLKDGFSEYELKMESVKRILNSAKNADGTAVSLGQVNERLDELNKYADKTIYSFSDMTTNIGKFTNAGVDLDKSVLAIQGIANEAALAGANSQEASRAMYNFAQALSSGYVKLIDWKSIENANMATVGFKEQLLETAVALGTVTKEGDKYVTTTTDMHGKVSEAFDATLGFNDSLSHQWMTSEVLTETLAKYADETTEVGKAAFKAATEVTTFSKLIDTLKEALGSGWAESWQLIIGDFDEAKNMWTAVNDVLSELINSSTDARNKLLEDWRALGGREALIQGLAQAWGGVLNVIRNVYWALQQVFPKIDGFDLTRLSASFRSLMTQFREFTGRYGPQISFITKGVASVFDLLLQTVSAVYRTIAPIFGPLGEIMDLLIRQTGNAGRSFADFVAHLRETDAIYNTLQKFVSVLQTVANWALNAGKAILGFFGIDVQVEEGSGFISTITQVFDSIAQNSHVQNGITILGNVRDAIVGFVTGLRDSDGFQKVVSGISKLGEVLAKIGSVVKNTVVQVFKNLGEAIKSLFDSTDGIKFDGFQTLFDVGFFTTIIALFKQLFKVLKGTDALTDLFKSFSSVKDIFGQAKEALTGFAKSITAPLKELTMSIKADVLIKIAKAIAILAASILVLSLIEPSKLGVALFGLAAIMTELTASMAAMSKLLGAADAGKLTAAGASFIAFSAAIGILSIAVAGLSQIDPDKLVNGVLAVGILMTLMTLMTRLSGTGINTKGMLSMSVAILIIQKAVVELSKIDADNLVNGVAAVGILMTLMTLMSKLGGKNFSGAGLIGMAAAVLILQRVVKTFGDMDTTALVKGVAGVSALIIAMGLFSRISGKNALTASIGTIALAASMSMLQKVIAAFGEMDPEVLGQGMMTVGLSLGAMAVAMTAMTGTLAGAAALVVATLALKMLVPVIQTLAALPFTDVLKGVASLALVFGVLAVAGIALGPLVPALLGLAGAIALVGIGVAALGAGLLVAGIGLTTFSASLVANVASIIASIGLIVAAIIEAIPFVVNMIARGIIMILKAIGDSAQTIVQVVVQIGTALIGGLRDLLAPLGQFIVEALMFIITLLSENAPTLTNAVVEMAINVIDGLAMAIYNNTDKLIAAVHHVLGAIVDFVLATLQEILKGIPGVGGKINDAIAGIREDIAKTMSKEEGEKLGQNLTDGIADGTRSGASNVQTAGSEAGEAGKQGLMASLGVVPGDVETLMKEGLSGAMAGSSGEMNDAAFTLGEGGAESLKEGLGGFYDAGKFADEGFTNGLLENQGLITGAVGTVSNGSLTEFASNMGINSPSTKTWDMGKNLDEGLANGVTDNQGIISTSLSGLASSITTGFGSLVSAFSSAGSSHGASYARGLNSSMSSASNAGRTIGNSASNSVLSTLPKFSQNGSVSGISYATGINITVGAARTAGSTVGASAVTGLGTAKSAFSSTGVSSGGRYATGVSSKKGEAKTAGTGLGNSAVSGAKSVSGFYEAGRDSSQGYINGLLSKAKDIATSAANMVRNALNAAKDAIDSHSPSRAYEQLGIDSDEGYILGVKRRSGKVNNTLDTLAKDAMGAFYEGLSRANSAANDELVVMPTVAPVMDLNNVYGGVDYLRDVFNGADNVLGSITADVGNNIEDIREIVANTKQILTALNGRKPITIDGKTVIGWVDMELGAL